MKTLLVIMAVLGYMLLPAQAGYQPGNVVQNLSFPTVLNAPAASSSFGQMKGKLTIVDFFGTWCAPCIRALPKLSQLQQAYHSVNIILISTEEESRLQDFLAKRPGFPFPVVVDMGGMITALFQPPSLPYTVILDENGKVLSITEAAALNDKTIANWLAGQGAEMRPPVLSTPKTNHLSTINASFMQSANRLVKLSQDFVYAARTGENVVEFVQALQAIDYIQLRSTLSADNEKKAFWINLYNGFTQNLLRQNPAQYKSRSRFFRKKQITVAGQQFSLDDIEHGILRRSKIKWSLGYLNKLFPSKTERELRVAHLDYRIHFALNCGAKSCPPIAFYAPEKLDQQLALATKSYLQGEVDYKDADKTFFLPAIMSWFRRDFGGKKGMRNLLQQHGFTNVHSSTRIAFKDYDWSLYLDNFKNL